MDGGVQKNLALLCYRKGSYKMKSEKNNLSRFTKIVIICIICLMYIPGLSLSGEMTSRFERMWPTLEQPWYFIDPYDVAIDNDGYVYVVNEDNSLIQKFTGDGQLVTQWGKEGSGDGEMIMPRGIAADKNGYIYVTDTENHRIQKFTWDGQFVTQWGKEGGGDGEFDRPYAIAADSTGYIYVADTYNHRIQKFTAKGEFVSKWGISEQDFNPHSIATDNKGEYIYVADTFNKRILKFTTNGELVEWGDESDENRVVKNPYITTDSNGSVYVAFEHAVRKFTSDGEFKGEWGTKGSGLREFNNPRGIAVGKNGYIYVADMSNQRIQKLAPEGQFVAKWGMGSETGEFNSPNGIVLDSEGYVYVVDKNNHRIQKFTEQGEFVRQWGSYGKETGEFMSPQSIAIDSKDRVYVADMWNWRIQRFSKDGIFETEWASEESEWLPFDIAVDSRDHIYVTDIKYHCINKFTENGEFITKLGKQKELKSPKGIAIDSNNFVYVTDISHHVRKFNPKGEIVLEWGGEGSGDGEFSFPKGMSVYNDTLYVADSKNHRIQFFDLNGKFLGKWGENGNDPGQMSYPHDLAISPEGNIYITDTFNHRVQMFILAALDFNDKAIIVAGGGPYPGNKLWDATQTCANFAYRTLTYQGFTKESIHYLTDGNIDLDNNGELDDVDGPTTNANLEKALTEWASQDPAADSLVIYLVDHGGNGTFRMSETETLSATKLDSWLDAVQEKISGKVNVIYDACSSGSFIPALANENRIVMTGASAEEEAYFITQGSVSFSNFFWTHIFNGEHLETAFAGASEAIRKVTRLQNPMIDGNGDGIGTTDPDSADGYSVRRIYIGNGTAISGQAPVIGSISPDQTISETGTAGLYAEDVTDPDGIARVWAVIIPPSYRVGATDNPVLELPSVELMPVQDQDGRYEGRYDRFNSEGTYTVSVYARDRKGNTSVPKQTRVRVGNPPRRKAVIMVGDSSESGTEDHASLAYHALAFQGYRAADIYFMSPSAFQTSLYRKPTLSNLRDDALGIWAEDAQDVVLFLTGKGGEKTFQISDTETLRAGELDNWLDILQNNQTSCRVTVVYDADYSGSFLPLLTPAEDKERILIASTSGTQHTLFDSNGAVSFSAFFWNSVMNGMNLRDVFLNTRDAISFFSENVPDKMPGLDDDGNGIPNQASDGLLSVNHTIGAGIRRAGTETSLKQQVSSADFYPDTFEEDDTFEQANFIVVGAEKPQHHNFYDAGDEDWVKFNGDAGDIYTIEAGNLGKNCNAVLALYEGKDRFLGSRRRVPFDMGRMIWYWKCERDGDYHIKVRNADPEVFGEGTGYDLAVYPPSGTWPTYLWGFITDTLTEEAIKGAEVKSDDIGLVLHSGQDGGYQIDLPPLASKIKITVNASGYEDKDRDVEIAEADMKREDFELEPLPEYHSADYNPQDYEISLSELLRVIQLYNKGIYHCDSDGEDGYDIGEGDESCKPHDSDYSPRDWRIGLSELLRLIQLYNSSGYHADPGGEDGFVSEK